MAEYVIMPKADYEAACNSIRAKTGKTDLIKSGSLSTEIDSITSGGGSSADVRYVTFMNGDIELYRKPVAVGDDCVDVHLKGLIDTPTKESTAQYNYVFYGWGASDGGAADSTILNNITEDKTVYAVYSAVVRSYTITYYDSDGTTVLKQEQLAYGTVPSYAPTKAGDTFEKWNPTPVAVTGDASYVAKWAGEISGALNDGAVTWGIANNVLTFRGTGEIPNQSRKYDSSVNAVVSTAPWYKHRSKFTSVVIGEGITRIGNYAFYDCTGVTSVSFPSTLAGDAFGNDSFTGCSGVTHDIVIPEGVTVLRDLGNFASSSLTLPQSLEQIILSGGWRNVKTVTIPANVNYIYQFGGNNAGFTSVTFENPSGWTVKRLKTDTPVSIDVSSPARAATYLKTTYATYYWNRT